MNEKKILNQLIDCIMEERKTGINPDDVKFEQILENELKVI